MLGAALRWFVISEAWSGAGVRWGVLALNVGGSALLGVLLASQADTGRSRLVLHDFGAIGFCGGLTTFSTFSLETVELLRAGDVADAAVHGGLSLSLSVSAVLAGAAALRRASAAGGPVEERP